MPPFKSSLPRFPVFSPLSGVFGCKRTCSRRAFSWAGERRQRTLELRFALPPVATRNGLAQPTRIGAPRPWNGPLAPFAPWPNALQVGVHHDRRTVTLPKSTHFLPTKFLEYPGGRKGPFQLCLKPESGASRKKICRKWPKSGFSRENVCSSRLFCMDAASGIERFLLLNPVEDFLGPPPHHRRVHQPEDRTVLRAGQLSR